jgi:hypothetical protein
VACSSTILASVNMGERRKNSRISRNIIRKSERHSSIPHEWRSFMETPLRIRNILFKAFIINLIVIIVIWLLSLSSAFANLMQSFFGFDAHQSHMYMAGMIGIWKILNVVLFLIPAIAIHWEYRPKT